MARPSLKDQTMTDILFANARIVLPEDTILGILCLRDGRIADISEGGAIPEGATDCGGDFLAPGLIELHTDNLERHIQPRPGVDWPHAAAIVAHDAELAGCGITTVFDAMRVGSIPGKTGDYAKYARGLATELAQIRARGGLRITHKLHLRAEVCSETLTAELAEFDAGDEVGIVSLMDHTPGQRQFRDLSKLEQYVRGKRGMSEAEFADHVTKLHGLRETYGAQHEAATVARARALGATLASHDDTTAEQVATSAGYGIRLAEFPTTLEAARACRAAGIAVMMGAPNLIRGGSHSGNVAARDLAEAGLLDVVSSDYVPAALLSAAVLLGDLWDDLPRGLATVTAAPAAATGLTDRGRIAPGLRADLIRFARIEGTPVLRETWVAGRRVA
ncbi:alpha-D-ribose 1-methylphosphonate 5-triphosphate diphosphatase [Frigidibacter sp. MR17.14]|uniref:alpha-D-ribose 1-methylphosphonate 5-triphosphate diphosphatase n=1 Tax=Frigidibacter sp. MR17.14 TaxID=3126509 RepID=UPI003012A13A